MPTKVTLEADGTPARTLTVPPITGVPGGPTVHTVTIPFAPVTVQHRVRLFIDDIQDQRATTNPDEANVVLPVSIAEARLVGVPVPRAGAGVDTGCRDDLVHVNGTPVPIRVVGPATAARSGVSIQPCTGPLTLRKGSSVPTRKTYVAMKMTSAVTLRKAQPHVRTIGKCTPPTPT